MRIARIVALVAMLTSCGSRPPASRSAITAATSRRPSIALASPVPVPVVPSSNEPPQIAKPTTAAGETPRFTARDFENSWNDAVRGIEPAGEVCGPPTAWKVCEQTARDDHDRDQLATASQIYETFCAAGNDDACYQGAVVTEADVAAGRCEGRWTGPTYQELCRRGRHDACQRMCTVAMKELVNGRDTRCDLYATLSPGGVGDGTWQASPEYEAVLALCPKSRWTTAVRKRMKKDDEYHHYLDRMRSGVYDPPRAQH